MLSCLGDTSCRLRGPGGGSGEGSWEVAASASLQEVGSGCHTAVATDVPLSEHREQSRSGTQAGALLSLGQLHLSGTGAGCPPG